MMKRYEAIGALGFQIQPPEDNRFIPVGYGEFEADLHPKREEFLLLAGIVRVVEVKAKEPRGSAPTPSNTDQGAKE